VKQVVSIAMSLLLLLSSSGITYAQHFCGDHEIMSKITLGETHLSCEMIMPEAGCEDEPMKENNCCDNQYINVDTDDNYSGVSFDFQAQPTFIIAFVSVFVLAQEPDLNKNFDYYKDYSPPPLGEDLLVLFETFLI